MWKTILFLIFIGIWVDACLHNSLAELAYVSHRICLDLSPTTSAYRSLYSAMICGADPSMSHFAAQLRTVGLYHLLVVSGSHLVFIEILLLFLFKPMGRLGQWLTFATLIFFTLICNLAPPVTRALISFMLRKVNEESKLFWSAHHLALASGILTLLLFPAWLSSLSFIMSWCAALFVSLPAKSSWQKHLVIFLGLTPIVCGLQPLHPVTGLINWSLAPLLGFILLPLCFVAFIFHPATYLVDLVWWFFDKLTARVALEIPLQDLTTRPLFVTSWLYIFAAHVVSYYYLRRLARSVK